MPKFKLPPLSERNESEEPAKPATEGAFPDEWDRKIRIPVNKAILDAMKVGDSATITLTGEIEQLSSDQSENRQRSMLTIEISDVEAYPNNRMPGEQEPDVGNYPNEQTEEDMERGFRRTRSGTGGFGFSTTGGNY